MSRCSTRCLNSKGCRIACKKLPKFGAIIFYDDSKGTNVGATVAAL